MKNLLNALLYTLVFVGIQLTASAAVMLVWPLLGIDGDNSTTAMLITSMATFSIATLAVFLLLRWFEPARSYLQSRPWTVLLWCGVAAIGAIIPSTFLQEQLPELPNNIEQELGMILGNRWGYFIVGLLAPLVEEMVFRGAVLRSLLQWKGNHWAMIALSALIFALVHGNPAQMPHAFIIGLLLGWMYYRSRSIVPGVVYHWVNNSIAYALYQFYPDSSVRLQDIFGSESRALLAVAFSLLILLPAIYQLWLNLRPAEEDSH